MATILKLNKGYVNLDHLIVAERGYKLKNVLYLKFADDWMVEVENDEADYVWQLLDNIATYRQPKEE